MLQKVINPLLIAFTVITAVGVLTHDTQLDKAATVAIALPAVIAGYAASDGALKFSDGAHTHVERITSVKNHGIRQNTVPRLQPRDDDVRYLTNKRSSSMGGDVPSLWPST